MSDSNEVFHTGNGAPANFNDGKIKLSVNGQVVSATYSVGALTIGQFVDQIARQKGIKTFSVYADGEKLTTEDAASLASTFTEVDIVAKDARGFDAAASWNVQG
jgi:hypothetical protein